MKPILIFRHWPSEGPGYLADVLTRKALPWHLIAIDAGEPVPATLEHASALVFMGGPMSVNDPLPWLEHEINLIRTARARGMPVLGHCLGGQLIAKAMGGVITRNPVREIGWLPVMRTEHAVADDWLRDMPVSLEVFHWHGETFSLPVGATLLFASHNCPHQGFVAGNILALQCHVEMTATLVQTWAQENPAELAVPTATIQSAATMMTDLPARIANLHRIADCLYERWLSSLI